MARPASSRRFLRARFLLVACTLLSLFLSGGIYAHAHETNLHDKSHAENITDDHARNSGCPNCKGDERPVHCGANILMTTTFAEPVHPVPVGQIAETRYSQMTGHLLAPESPPPRTIPVFDM